MRTFNSQEFLLEVENLIKNNTAIAYEKNSMGNITRKKINVVIHIPPNLHEHIKQQKINRIYDLLNHKTSN